MQVSRLMSKLIPSCIQGKKLHKAADEINDLEFHINACMQKATYQIRGDILQGNRLNEGLVDDGNESNLKIFHVNKYGSCQLHEINKSGTSELSRSTRYLLLLAADGKENCARLLDVLCEPSSRFEQAMLSRSSMGDDVALRLARALAHGCISIHSLLLPQNGITASGARWLSAGLRLHGQLCLLDLSYNCCSDDGAESLALLVRDSAGLRTLRLRGNGVGPRGATALAAALSTTSSVRTSGLEQLDLSLNCLRDSGATALASALSGDCTLRELDVSRSMVTAGGSAALATAMQRSATLQRLCVRATAMSAEEAAALEGLRRKCMDGARGTM